MWKKKCRQTLVKYFQFPVVQPHINIIKKYVKEGNLLPSYLKQANKAESTANTYLFFLVDADKMLSWIALHFEACSNW